MIVDRQERRLVNVHSNAMPKTMPKGLAVPDLGDDFSSCRIHFCGRHLSRTHGNDSRSLRIHHKFVNVLIFGIGLAKEYCAPKIVTKAIIHRAHIKQDCHRPSGQVIGQSDPAKQAYTIINKIEQAISELGGSLADVVRTRVYVSNLEHWEAVAAVHGERFAGINPANTLVEARLIGEEYLVEIEAEAIIGVGNAL